MGFHRGILAALLGKGDDLAILGTWLPGNNWPQVGLEEPALSCFPASLSALQTCPTYLPLPAVVSVFSTCSTAAGKNRVELPDAVCDGGVTTDT